MIEMLIRISLTILLITAVARAEGPQVAVARVDPGVCFDAAHLAARLRDNLGGGEVRIGGGAAETVVAVTAHAGTLEVVVTRRAGGNAQSERRSLPAEGNCGLLTDAVALIVARIAAPIGYHAPAVTPPAAPVHATATATNPAPHPTTSSRPVEKPIKVARAASPEPAPPADPPPTSQDPPPTSPTVTPPVDEPITIEKPSQPPHYRARLFLAAEFRYSLPLDGDDDSPRAEPGFLGEVAVRVYRRLLLVAAAGFEKSATVGDNRPGAVLTRIPLHLGAAWELRIPSGAIRFGAGGLLEIWEAQATHVSVAREGNAVHPGVYAAVAYHLIVGHFLDLFAGVDFEYTWVTERFVVDPEHEVASTPTSRLCPFAGASVNFF
jgi:hypothetical protein